MCPCVSIPSPTTLPGNGAFIFEPKYAIDEVHGPVKTKLGYHLIKIEKRVVAAFDFRAKEGQLPKANVWDDSKKG